MAQSDNARLRLIESAGRAGEIARDMLNALGDGERDLVWKAWYQVTNCFRRGANPPAPDLATAKALHIIADSIEVANEEYPRLRDTFREVASSNEDKDDNSAWSKWRVS